MRFFFQSAVAVCAVFLVLAAATGLAAEGEVAAAPVVAGSFFWPWLWTMLNSPVAATVIASILAAILGKIFLAKPEWKVVYEKYKPAFMAAVKYAEKLIPDETPSAGLRRLDVALQKVVEIDAALNSVPTPILTQVMNMVHAEAESGGNI